MILSQQAWQLSANIIQTIKQHPFNQELMQGTLPRDKFAYYIEQDTIYLRDFARCHATIAAKISLPYVQAFLRFANGAFIAENEIVHEYFRKAFNFKETGLLTPATLSYTNYLLRICAYEPVEMAVAAILPCFWIYQDVGHFIAQQAAKDNPYARWIETYASEEFAASVTEIIHIFDELAENTTEEVRKKMLDAFYKSTCLEWHFWNDAYYQTAFDNTFLCWPVF